VTRLGTLGQVQRSELGNGINHSQVTYIPWLEPPNAQTQASNPARHKLSLSDLRKRTELLHELVYYIFDSLLIPLIRTNFYVTESQIYRNRLFYFRHDVWRRLTEQPWADIKSSMFEEIQRRKAYGILARRPLGYSTLRLLPKAAGARPIINLRKKTMKTASGANCSGTKHALGPSINSLMTPVFNMLNYEKLLQPGLLGSAMPSVNGIYPRLKVFKAKLLERSHLNGEYQGQLYFVKLDISSCFDTIPQNEVVKLVEDVVSKEAYHVTKHAEIRPPLPIKSPVSPSFLPAAQRAEGVILSSLIQQCKEITTPMTC
jgi:telomerase reverse transcriptase